MAVHQGDEHVFQVGLADFDVLDFHAGFAQGGQVAFDLGRVVRRQLGKASEVIAQLYGVVEADRTMRKTTAECIQRERDAGRIR